MLFLRPIFLTHGSRKTEGRHVWVHPQGKETAWSSLVLALGLQPGGFLAAGSAHCASLGVPNKALGSAPAVFCLALPSGQLGGCGKMGFELSAQGTPPYKAAHIVGLLLGTVMNFTARAIIADKCMFLCSHSVFLRVRTLAAQYCHPKGH